jgi:hypothetical protein
MTELIQTLQAMGVASKSNGHPRNKQIYDKTI